MRSTDSIILPKANAKNITIIYFCTTPNIIIKEKLCINSRTEMFIFYCFEVNELNSFKMYTVSTLD